MIQAFYQVKPERDTPYRELVLKHDEPKGWRVLLLGGESWGKQASSPISEVAVRDFSEGKTEFDKLFAQLTDTGWRPYSPYEMWD
jgi:hypothetical protein